MGKRGPLAATDKRRQAGHKRARHVASFEEDDSSKGTGKAPHLAHLFHDRRTDKPGEGKRAI